MSRKLNFDVNVDGQPNGRMNERTDGWKFELLYRSHMKTITVDEVQNWLQDNTKFIILKSFICACAAIFMNLIRNGLNDCTTKI